MLHVRVLGGFEVRVNGVLITDFQSVKAEALLAYLAYSKHPVRRDGLAGLLWTDQDQQKAQTNLRKTLSRLKQAIEINEAEYIKTDHTFLQLDETACDIDVLKFERLLQACPKHRNLHDMGCGVCMKHLEEAVGLYGGEFLKNIFVENAELFEDWLVVTREYLHNQTLNALQYLTRYYEFQGDYVQSLKYAHWQLRLEPWLEETHRLIMRLLLYQGEYNAALGHYRLCAETLQKHLGVEPALETRQLVKRIQTLPEKRPHNLPTSQDKTYVKRNQEYNYIRQQLVKPGSRLLTVTGLGGIGKTTLALEVAWSIIKEHFGPFVEGVCYITLLEEELRFSRLVTEIADFFSIPLSQSPHPEKTLFQHLKQKECLLILDNGEYLGGEGKRFIDELLKLASSVKILVVSRESLKLSSEWLLAIDGLSLPEIYPSSLSEEHPSSDALTLFEHRSERIIPGFHWEHLNSADQRALLQICHLTQGLPLALELAASWVAVLSCQQIASEIQKSLDILVSQYQDAPDRHRSIRAVFAYSWTLLSEQQQQDLIALSVFPGDFDLEAAVQIVRVNLFALSALIDRSLLKSVLKSGRVYYQLHNLLRQFVQEHCPVEHMRELQLRHSAYYARFLGAYRSRLNGPEAFEIYHDVSLELDNIRASWQWGVQNQDFQLLDSLIDGFYDYYALKGWWQEGLGLFMAAYETFQSLKLTIHPDNALFYARLLTRITEFNYSLGQLAQAEQHIQQAEGAIQLVEEPEEMSLIYEKIGRVAYQYGNFERAEQNLQFSLQIIDSHDPQGLQKAHSLMALGAVVRDRGGWQEAETIFQQSLTLYQKSQYDWGIAHIKRLLANLFIGMGRLSDVAPYAQEGLDLFRKLNDLIGQALTLRELGRLAAAQQHREQAETYLRKALEILKQKENIKGQGLLHKDLGSLFVQGQRYGEAQHHFFHAFDTAYRTRDTLLLMESLALFVEAKVLENQTDLRSDEFVALKNFLYYNVNIHRSKIGPILTRIEECFPPENNLLEDYSISIEDIYILVTEHFIQLS
jgi:DNA-binding SARP family transcriptional activator/predicted ATPase/uncharacterized protein HemY